MEWDSQLRIYKYNNDRDNSVNGIGMMIRTNDQVLYLLFFVLLCKLILFNVFQKTILLTQRDSGLPNAFVSTSLLTLDDGRTDLQCPLIL